MIEEEIDITNIEYCLLGWICQQNELLDSLEFLSPRHFASNEHANVYEQMLIMRAAGEIITPLTLNDKIHIGDGTRRYMMRAVMQSTAMIHPVEEARTLIEISNKRAIEELCLTKLQTIGSKSPEQTIADLTDGLEKILNQGTGAKFFSDKQVTERILERLNTPRKPFSTGIPKLDAAMEGGLFPGMNYLFAARKKVGKTTLASTISCNLNIAGVKHLFICAEMSDLEIQQRIISRMTETYTSSFRNSFGKSPAFQAKVRAQIEASNGCIIYQSAPGITFDELRSSVAQAMSIHKIQGFILDSLQLVGGKSSKKSTAEHQDEVAQWCADFGRQRNLFSIVTAQVNQTGGIRGGEGIRLACDQGYEIHAPGDDPSRSDRWVEMIETRYTPWMNIGSKDNPALLMHEYGQYFHEPIYTM